MKLSIIIPAHNEESTIEQMLYKVLSVDLGDWQKEIIVVNDGSTDKTKGIIQRWESSLRENSHLITRVIHHPVNLGKGAGIKSALERVSGDYVIIQDADLEYDPGDIPDLLSLISDAEQAVVFGKRGYGACPERGFHYVVGAWMLTAVYNFLFGQKLTDLYTCYKLIPAEALKSLNIQSAGFEFEAEVACKLAKLGYKIVEMPIHYRPRNKSQGKHIGLNDFFKGFWAILKYRVK